MKPDPLGVPDAYDPDPDDYSGPVAPTDWVPPALILLAATIAVGSLVAGALWVSGRASGCVANWF